MMADVRHDFVRTFRRRLETITLDELIDTAREHEASGNRLLHEQGLAETSGHEITLAMLYEGQRHAVDVQLDAADLDTDLLARFEREYRRTQGDCLDRPVVLVSLRSTVFAHVESPALSACAEALRTTAPVTTEKHITATFAGTSHRTRVIDRSALDAGVPIEGPAILMQRDSTTLVEPGFSAIDTAEGILRIRRVDG